jgi:hypothetical protein
LYGSVFFSLLNVFPVSILAMCPPCKLFYSTC